MPSAPYDSDEFAALYDVAWGDASDDAEMYEQFARRGETAALELGAGTGRIALYLARAGLNVVGLDASQPMLARFAAELDATTAPRVRLVAADMRGFDLDEQFDLIYCAANTFQHMLTTADQTAVLLSVARHLSAGGVYVMQVRAPRAIDWAVERTPMYLRWTRPVPGTGDQLMRFDSTTVSAAEQAATTTHLFDRVAPDGAVSRTVLQYTLRYSALSELRLLFAQAGLRVASVYGDTGLSPYTDESDTMILVAELKESSC